VMKTGPEIPTGPGSMKVKKERVKTWEEIRNNHNQKEFSIGGNRQKKKLKSWGGLIRKSSIISVGGQVEKEMNVFQIAKPKFSVKRTGTCYNGIREIEGGDTPVGGKETELPKKHTGREI